ncbi:hypothetical protein N184_35330 [Sinorhizobium sp. GL28]|nr:hypothetical protein N184_35330 [Sinorhizobium sp. GL28]
MSAPTSKRDRFRRRAGLGHLAKQFGVAHLTFCKRDFPCALTAVALLNRPRIGSDIRLY